MNERIILKLYIAGMTPAAQRAIKNLNDICAEISNGEEYVLEVIDILLHPQLAEDEKILATPTVIKQLPPPMRRLIGDFSVKSQVLIGLDLITSQ